MGCLAEDLVLSFVQGKLAPEGVEQVDRHVDTCSACRQLIAQLAQSSLAPAPNPSSGAPTVPLEGAAPPAAMRPGAILGRGTVVGRYVVLRSVGAGGMGVVYAAYDPELDRKVALKLLRLAVLPASLEADARQRLLREAQAMARIEHPNVIAVYDVGTFGGQVFVAMEFVDGWTLTQWLREAPRSWKEALRVLRLAGTGLVAAHAAGLVHRDFKPDNVLVGRDGRVLVSDFGLARAQGGEGTPPSANADLMPRRGETLEDTLTQTGAAVGTPAYMAPEQHLGKPPDPRSDQWSFCVTLYEALYGVRPFVADRVDLLVIRIASGEIDEPPKGRTVPGALRRAALRGLRVRPEERHPSMAALLAALDQDRARGWRRGAIALGTLAVLAAGAVGYARAGHEEPNRCRGATARLAGIWDPAQKATIRTAFLATGKPFAGDAWRGVETAIDGYAAAWTSMRTEACEATYVRGEQSDALLDLRMRCLDRRLGDLAALSAVYARADADVVTNAVKAARALATLDRCADADALSSVVAPPEDADALEAQAIEAQLAGVKALGESGGYAEALLEAENAAAAAGALGYRPLEAEALMALSDAQDQSGEPHEAEETAKAGVRAALAAKLDEMAARGWISLVHLVGYQQARHEEGYEWARYAEAAVARLSESEKVGLPEALDGHVGLIFSQEGRYDEAIQRYDRAIEGLRKRPELDLELARLLDALGLVRFDRGELATALSLHEEARAIREKTFGPDHPEIAASLGHVAAVQWAEGKYDDALASMRRVVAIEEPAVGPDALPVVETVMNIGVVLSDAGRPEEALVEFQRAAPILEAKLGPDHPDTARVHHNVGEALRRVGRFDEAERELRLGMAIWERSEGPQHVDVAMALYELGELRTAQRRYGEALAFYQRSMAIVEVSVGAEHRGASFVLAAIGKVYLLQGATARAVAPLERALELQTADRLDPVRLAETRFALARALGASGPDAARARSLASESREAFAAAGPRAKGQLAELDAWLSAAP